MMVGSMCGGSMLCGLMRAGSAIGYGDPPEGQIATAGHSVAPQWLAKAAPGSAGH